MKKLGIAVLAAASIAGATAQSASATAAQIDGPCATQQALFEKHNIQLDMYAPEVSWAYNTACGVTG